MNWFINNLFKRGTAASKNKAVTSYNTGRAETSDPQKVREANEPEAMQVREEKAR